MNTETGKLMMLSSKEIEMLSGTMEDSFIPIDIRLATEMQKQEMQVSNHDSKSPLGVIFTGSRKERREKERQYRKQQLKKPKR